MFNCGNIYKFKLVDYFKSWKNINVKYVRRCFILF